MTDLKSLFSLKTPAPSQPQANQQVATTPNLDHANPDSIQQGETNHNYGVRMCGKVAGSTAFLPPFLQRVFCTEKQKQAQDEQIQEEARRNIRNQINNKQADLDRTVAKIRNIEDDVQACESNIVEKRDQISTLRQEAGQGKNKEAKVKMIIGLVILIPLTFYLFIFYSSTFYSAFFCDFAKEGFGIGAAMFNPKAIVLAYQEGVTELFFILTAPIIFLGLGFSLHFFALQKSKSKYLKAGAIVFVTFVFDCILAYSIGKKIYELQMLFSIASMPPYTIGEAIGDSNIWAVIFCGFVVYIIWGIVFDMAMTAYNDYTSNKSEIDRLEKQIADEQSKKTQLQQQKAQEEANKIGITNEINKLQQGLSTSIVHYNEGVIKTSLSDFFAGWMSGMGTMNPADAATANDIYNHTLQTLFDTNNQAQQ